MISKCNANPLLKFTFHFSNFRFCHRRDFNRLKDHVPKDHIVTNQIKSKSGQKKKSKLVNHTIRQSSVVQLKIPQNIRQFSSQTNLQIVLQNRELIEFISCFYGTFNVFFSSSTCAHLLCLPVFTKINIFFLLFSKL